MNKKMKQDFEEFEVDRKNRNHRFIFWMVGVIFIIILVGFLSEEKVTEVNKITTIEEDCGEKAFTLTPNPILVECASGKYICELGDDLANCCYNNADKYVGGSSSPCVSSSYRTVICSGKAIVCPKSKEPIECCLDSKEVWCDKKEEIYSYTNISTDDFTQLQSYTRELWFKINSAYYDTECATSKIDENSFVLERCRKIIKLEDDWLNENQIQNKLREVKIVGKLIVEVTEREHIKTEYLCTEEDL